MCYLFNFSQCNKLYIFSESLKYSMSLAKQHIIKRLSLNIQNQFSNTKSSKCQNMHLHQQTTQLKNMLQQEDPSEEQYKKLQKKLRQNFTGNKKNNPQRNSLDQKYFFDQDDSNEKQYPSQACRQDSFNIVDCQNYFIEKSCCCNHQQTLQLQHLNSEIKDRDKTIKNLEGQIIGLKIKLISLNEQKQINTSLIQKNLELDNKYKQLENKEKQYVKEIQILKVQNKRMMENKELNQYLASKCISLKGYDASSISGLSYHLEDQRQKDLDQQSNLLIIEQFNRVNSSTQLNNNFTQFSERKGIQKQKRLNDKKYDKQTIKQSTKKSIIPRIPVSKVDSKTKSQNGCKNAKKINQTGRLTITANVKNTTNLKVEQKSDTTEKKVDNNTTNELQNLMTQIKQLRKQVTEKSSEITQKDGQIQELQSKLQQIKQYFTTIVVEKEQQKRILKRKNIILKQYINKLTNDNQKRLTFYKKNCMENFQNFFQEKKEKYQTKFMNIITMLRKHYFDEIKKQRKFQTRKQRCQRQSIEKIIKFINQDYENFEHIQFKDFQLTVEFDQIITSSIIKTEQQIQVMFQEQTKNKNNRICQFQTPQHKQLFRKIPQETMSTFEKSQKNTLKKEDKVVDMVDQQCQSIVIMINHQCQTKQVKSLMIVQRNLQLSINPQLSIFKSNIQTQTLIQTHCFIDSQCQTQSLKRNYASQYLCPPYQLCDIESQTTSYHTNRQTQTQIYQKIHKNCETKVENENKQTQITIPTRNYQQTIDFFHNKVTQKIQSQPIHMMQNSSQPQPKQSKLINTDLIQMVNAETNHNNKINNASQTMKIVWQDKLLQTQLYTIVDKLVGPESFSQSKSTQSQNYEKQSKALNTDCYQKQASIQVKRNIQTNNTQANTNELKSIHTQTERKVETAHISIITDTTTKEVSTQSKLCLQKIDFSAQVNSQNILSQMIGKNNQNSNKEIFTQTIQQTICSTKKQETEKQRILIKIKDKSFSQIPTQSFINQKHETKEKNQQCLNLEQKSTLHQLQKQVEQQSQLKNDPFKIEKQQRKQQIDAISDINDTISEINSCFEYEPLNKSMLRQTHFQNHETINRKQNNSNDHNMTRNNDKSKQIIVELTTDQYKNLPIEVVLQKIFKSIPQGFIREDKLQFIDKKFKWKPQKYYYLQTVSDTYHLQKFLLWKKGLLSLSSGKFLRLKPKGLIAQNKDMLILGNSQVIASGNQLKVRLKKRNQLIGNLQNGTWKILNCQIFLPKTHSQFF